MVKNRKSGFTLVEVIIVIAIIGILATISALGINSFLAQSRDGKRLASVTTISEGLEKYFNQNGEYPSCSVLSTNAAAIFGDISSDALVAPRDTATNSLDCGTLTLTGRDFYQYQGDGSVTCQEGLACLTYKLLYRSESEKKLVEINSRRSVSISTSGIPEISARGTSFDKITAGWNAVLNATGYTLQVSKNASFTNIVETKPIQAYSWVASGLSYDTTYYFRVRAESATGSGQWSATATADTKALTQPTGLVANAQSFTQINTSWNAVSGATGYQLQVAKNAAFSDSLQTLTSTGTSTNVTALSYNTAYYFRVRATWNSNTGPWSSVISKATNSLAAPQSLMASANSKTQATATWKAVTGATSYQLDRSTTNTFTSGTTTSITGITSVSRAITGLSPGVTYYVRVKAVWSGNNGPWSNVANVTTYPANPTNLALTASMSGTNAVGQASADCSVGQVRYRFSTMSTNTSTDGTYATGSWAAADTSTKPASQGYKYGFKVSAKCVDGSRESDEVAVGPKTTVRPINTPDKPTISKSASGDYGNADSVTWSWSSSCPSGTNTKYSSAYYRDDTTGWRQWVDKSTTSTQTQPTSGQGYKYAVKAKVTCSTPHSTSESVESNTLSYIREIASPTEPTGFHLSVKTVSGSPYSSQWGMAYWDSTPTCASGLVKKFRMRIAYKATYDNAPQGAVSAIGSADNIFYTDASTPQDTEWNTPWAVDTNRQWYQWKHSWQAQLRSEYKGTYSSNTSGNHGGDYWDNPTVANNTYWVNWIPTESMRAGVVSSGSAPYGNGRIRQLRVHIRYACINPTTNRYAVGSPGMSLYQYF